MLGKSPAEANAIIRRSGNIAAPAACSYAIPAGRGQPFSRPGRIDRPVLASLISVGRGLPPVAPARI